MPTIEPANIQQILQMSPLVEKAQQTTQQQPAVLAQQLNQEDSVKLNELKRTEIQDPDQKDPTDPTNSDGKAGQGRLRTNRKGKGSQDAETETNEVSPMINGDQGNKIDVVI